MQDPIFEPWFTGEEEPSSSEALLASEQTRELPRKRTEGAAAFLRRVGTAGLESVSRRLRMARHRTSVEDLLDDPASRLLRFELTPWLGPLAMPDLRRSAMLEMGVGGESDELVTAWYWLDRFEEAPHEVATVPSAKLDAAWIERVIIDFVSKVLERS